MGGRHVSNFNAIYHHFRKFMKTGRPVYKPPYVPAPIMWLFRNTTETVRIKDKDTVILPEMVGREVSLHIGNDWVAKKLTEEMIGKRMDEFVTCKKRIIHKKKASDKQALLLQRLKKRGH